MHHTSHYRHVSFALASLIPAFLALISVVAAADTSSKDNVVWNWPLVTVGPDALDTVHTYNTIDTLNASWTSNLNYNPFLVVWCQAPGGFTSNQSGSVLPNGWHLVPLNLGLTTRYPQSCHLSLQDKNHNQLSNANSNSGSFNITNVVDNDPQVFGIRTSVAATATATTAAANPPTGATTVVVQSGPSDNSNSLSSGAIAGIVIGLVLGIGSIIGVLVVFYLRKRRRDRRAAREKATMTGTVVGEDIKNYTGGSTDVQGYVAEELDGADKKSVVEKDAERQPVEMAAEEGQTEPQGPVELDGRGDHRISRGENIGKSGG